MADAPDSPRFPGPGHDHGSCIEAAVAGAAELCRARGARLTELRRHVLEIVWRGHEPIGAYDILRRLNEEGRGAAPVTVYRALEFLMAEGLVHRLNSLNAFCGCAHPARPHGAQFLICRNCRTVAEMEDSEIDAAIARGARAAGFRVEAPVVEIEGLCPNCAGRA